MGTFLELCINLSLVLVEAKMTTIEGFVSYVSLDISQKLSKQMLTRTFHQI